MKLAIKYISFSLIGFLIVQGKILEPSTPSIQPLINALDAGNVQQVTQLATAANVNEIYYGYSILSYTITSTKNPKHEIVQALIKAGANVNYRDDYGNTALMYAVSSANPNPKIVEVLIKAGANLAITNLNGDTALISAVFPKLNFQPNPDVVTILINSGANVNAVNTSGDTALICLLMQGQTAQAAPIPQSLYNNIITIMNALITKGANVNAQDDQGYTPLWIAQNLWPKSQNQEVINKLKAAGAK